MTTPPVTVTASPAPRITVPTTDAPDVSVVIVTFGTGPIVMRTLASLVRSLEADLTGFEVIVVDNPHPTARDRTFTDLRLSTAGVRVVRPDRNLGFGGGCELGALHARADVLAFVNPDVTFEPAWIGPLLDGLRRRDRDPVASIVAPVLLEPDRTVQEAGQVLHADGSTEPVREWPDAPTEVDYSSAACWLMTRDEHERLGGFDPAYHPAYYEDVDLALRARRSGGATVVCPAASVVHHRGSGTPDAAPSTERQRATLLSTWPEIAWRQPAYLR